MNTSIRLVYEKELWKSSKYKILFKLIGLKTHTDYLRNRLETRKLKVM